MHSSLLIGVFYELCIGFVWNEREAVNPCGRGTIAIIGNGDVKRGWRGTSKELGIRVGA
jgi:hypothetical protein